MKKSHLLTSFLTLFFVSSCSCSFFHSGNANEFAASNQLKKENILNNKKFYYLGSSVTLGMESGNEALPEYLYACDGISFEKETKSGTTLKGTTTDDSYIGRLMNTKKFNKSEKIDAFVIQLSTNDAKKGNVDNFGNVKDGNALDLSAYDINTTIGGLEYIINYVEKTRDTKVIIYTNAYFSDEGKKSVNHTLGSDYKKLIYLTSKLEEKYDAIEGFDVTLVDLFNNQEFNDITDDAYELYMFDAIHPTKAGYLKWWTPFVEKNLLELFK